MEQEVGMNVKGVEVGATIDVDATSVEEATEKVEALSEAMADITPMVTIRSLRGCTVNVYVSRNTWSEKEGE